MRQVNLGIAHEDLRIGEDHFLKPCKPMYIEDHGPGCLQAMKLRKEFM